MYSQIVANAVHFVLTIRLCTSQLNSHLYLFLFLAYIYCKSMESPLYSAPLNDCIYLVFYTTTRPQNYNLHLRYTRVHKNHVFTKYMYRYNINTIILIWPQLLLINSRVQINKLKCCSTKLSIQLIFKVKWQIPARYQHWLSPTYSMYLDLCEHNGKTNQEDAAMLPG